MSEYSRVILVAGEDYPIKKLLISAISEHSYISAAQKREEFPWTVDEYKGQPWPELKINSDGQRVIEAPVTLVILYCVDCVPKKLDDAIGDYPMSCLCVSKDRLIANPRRWLFEIMWRCGRLNLEDHQVEICQS